MQSKKKPPQKAAPKPQIIPAKEPQVSAQRMKLLEEFAVLDQEVANFKSRLLRHEKLRSLILGWNPALPPDEEQRLISKTCDIIITSRDRIRSVSPGGKKALYKLWGSSGFIAKSIVLLKSLPDPEDKGGLYTVQAPIGPRHLKVVKREQATRISAA